MVHVWQFKEGHHATDDTFSTRSLTVEWYSHLFYKFRGWEVLASDNFFNLMLKEL